ncbi:MAG: IS4 family transposase, partial [Anaerolineae bacterium]
MMSSSTQEWVDEEFNTLDLGDTRRDRRARAAVEAFADNPGGSIPQVSRGPAEAKAIYRFLSNDAVQPDALRAALRDAALQRLGDDDTIIVPQDTTCLNFTTHQVTEGLGPLGAGDGSAGYGIFVHSAIGVSADGVPLGLLHQHSWARSKTIGRKHKRKQRPIEEKESFRWLQTARAVEAAVPADKRLIQVADREGDFFELLAEQRRDNSYLLLRVHQNRRLKGDERLLWDRVGQMQVAHTLHMLVHTSHSTTVRKARLELRLGPVTILPPKDGVHDKALQAITLNAIEVREVDAPEGAKPILWRLLTDLPVESVEHALSCVRYYELRWLIERYHYVLKSGCGMEDSQLRS